MLGHDPFLVIIVPSPHVDPIGIWVKRNVAVQNIVVGFNTKEAVMKPFQIGNIGADPAIAFQQFHVVYIHPCSVFRPMSSDGAAKNRSREIV